MSKIYLVFNGGSGNRGCEAIVRGTGELLGWQNLALFSAHIDEERESGLTKLCDCIPIVRKSTYILEKANHICCWLSYHFGSGIIQVKILFHEVLKRIKSGDTYLVIGGDVYCYGRPYIYYHLNRFLKDSKRILWGCSIEPDSIDADMKADLQSYHLIYARESLTYDALVKHGLKNVVLLPDPAFKMKCVDIQLPDGIDPKNMIGINLSPLIIEKEKKNGITFKNYCDLIEHILSKTECSIVLIPHVIWSNSDDRIPLTKLYEQYKDSNRIAMIDAYSAEKIKSVIAKCRFLIASRTHASIAAYSTCVPTLVVGYSVKARGIAKDIYGEYEHYTIPVQSLTEKRDLTIAFEWLWDRESEIREHLQRKIPEYVKQMDVVPNLVKMVEEQH